MPSLCFEKAHEARTQENREGGGGVEPADGGQRYRRQGLIFWSDSQFTANNSG